MKTVYLVSISSKKKECIEYMKTPFGVYVENEEQTRKFFGDLFSKGFKVNGYTDMNSIRLQYWFYPHYVFFFNKMCNREIYSIHILNGSCGSELHDNIKKISMKEFYRDVLPTIIK